MWAGKDNGKDVNWKNAVKYCRDLRLAGYSDWRLATLAELGAIYDRNANAPGLSWLRQRQFYLWHVKGNLFLTGNEWSSSRISMIADILRPTNGTSTSTKEGQTTSQVGSPTPLPSCVRCVCVVPETPYDDTRGLEYVHGLLGL